MTTAIEEAELSDLTREIFMDMLDQFNDLNRQLDKLDAHLVTICRTNETCRRLSKLPGVGPVIATALVAAVDDGRHFRSGRELELDHSYEASVWELPHPRRGRRLKSGGIPAHGGQFPARRCKFPARLNKFPVRRK